MNTNWLNPLALDRNEPIPSMEVSRKGLKMGSERDHTAHKGTMSASGSFIDCLDKIIPDCLNRSPVSFDPFTESNGPIVVSSLYRKILFSVANNFAGLEKVPLRSVFQYLETETGRNIYYILKSVKGYTARALIPKLFNGAIESGNSRIANMLLTEKLDDVGLNESFIRTECRFWTPVERAAYLGHFNVVRILLKHKADVNRTYSSWEEPMGLRIVQQIGLLACLSTREILMPKSLN